MKTLRTFSCDIKSLYICWDLCRYFAEPVDEFEQAEQDNLVRRMMNESLTFHFWNGLTSALVPEPNSLVERLLNQYCLHCLDILWSDKKSLLLQGCYSRLKRSLTYCHLRGFTSDTEAKNLYCSKIKIEVISRLWRNIHNIRRSRYNLVISFWALAKQDFSQGQHASITFIRGSFGIIV